MKYTIVAKNDLEALGLKEKIIALMPYEYDEKEPNIVITIGGDGTILKAVHKYIDIINDVYLVGIHTGHLGFYTNFNKDNIKQVIFCLKNKSYKIDEYHLLRYDLISDGANLSGYAINEVTLTNMKNVSVFNVLVDNKLFEQVRGTGMCISTPSGSTAYNKSLRGAVVDPLIEGLQITEIAAINSNAYRSLGDSMVVSNKRNITIKTIDDLPMPIHFTYDHLYQNFNDFIKIELFLSDKKVKFLNPTDNNFFDRVKRAFL